ncbi:MBL fold metallo-hydrolase [Piscinibacter koreensis]|uniref:MBL fold metallo-hydrolase n=1 Tax=Piscinibacter koreensis TaxID=2742824 RepID=A0A7Y6TY50_9BURK|nr:MBL fold metallo-hydrolase [Schlegelella koreensis]NUZ07760.1 MBL fold metallo-hydrolase [Schlegelella koreensis]
MRLKEVIQALVPFALLAGATSAWSAADPTLLKARQKFFGIDNVDVNTGAVKKDKVIASWATNTTYVVSVMGRVILLDSYITKPELPTTPIDRRYSPLLPQDLIDVRPEAIFLGHGHGDHADNAAYIAKWTNATIYATPETCDVMQQDVARMWADPNPQNGGAKVVPNPNPVNCVGAVPRGSRPGQYNQGPNAGLSKSSVSKLSTPLDAQVCVLAFKFIHSGGSPVDPSFPHTTLNDLGDPRYPGRTITTPPPPVTYPAMFPNLTPYTPPATGAVAGQLDTRTTGFGGPAGAYEVVYQFILRNGYNFNFFYLNSAGPAKEGIGSDIDLVTLAQYNDPTFPQERKDLARAIGNSLYDLMDTLPRTDVLLGSIVSLGAAANQQRDIILATQRLRPKVYIPGHHTDVAQKGSGIYHMISWKETAVNMGWPQSEWPEFRLLMDPNDFLVPQVWSPGDARWFDATKAGRVAQLCG